MAEVLEIISDTDSYNTAMKALEAAYQQAPYTIDTAHCNETATITNNRIILATVGNPR